MKIEEELRELGLTGNLRELPPELPAGFTDFTSNDYLGIASSPELVDEFMEGLSEIRMTSSASRLLASTQNPYSELENLLERLYGRPALLFNSGYHANTGIIPAIAADSRTLILADRLVHASIIDGIRLSRAEFIRFPHNDISRLKTLIERNHDRYDTILIITESIFSMDGDEAPLNDLLELKKSYPKVKLYLDEAHAFGIKGPGGLGKAQESADPEGWDIIVAPLGKAAASMGAFVVSRDTIKDYLVNKARSLIFSTALPPVQIQWTRFVVGKIPEMNQKREKLKVLSSLLADTIKEFFPAQSNGISHIQPLILGDALKTVDFSRFLYRHGIKALPIRKPTVPEGTERLRFSLTASMTEDDILKLKEAFKVWKNAE